MEAYFIKSGVSLVLFYLSYRFLLWQPQQHQYNRFSGLICVVFSAVLPFVVFENVQIIENTPVEAAVATVSESLAESFPVPVENTQVNAFWLIYLAGVLFFTLRFLRGVGKLFMFYLQGDKSDKWGFRLVQVNQSISPFTFFNLLFISTEEIKRDDLPILLQHERCHQQQWHSLDSLILEIATILFWFNPVVWLFQRDIRAEHEFIADQSVLKAGVDITDYQHLLFKSGTGVSLSIGNNLINKVSLIKRFNMMKQVKSKTQTIYYRIGVHVCLIAAITCLSAFGSPGMQTYDADTEPVYKAGEAEMFRFIRSQIKYPEEAKESGSNGQVMVSFRVKKDGSIDQVKAKYREGSTLSETVVVGYKSQQNDQNSGVSKALEKETERVIKLLGDFTPAEKDGKPVNAIVNIPVHFKLK